MLDLVITIYLQQGFFHNTSSKYKFFCTVHTPSNNSTNKVLVHNAYNFHTTHMKEKLYWKSFLAIGKLFTLKSKHCSNVYKKTAGHLSSAEINCFLAGMFSGTGTVASLC